MNYLISAFILTLAIPAFGLIIHVFNSIIYNILSRIFGSKIAMFIVNWMTFPGVIHHELSHTLFALLSGAKITGLQLFRPNGTSLGSVNFICRGNLFVRCFQYVYISIAPVLCGLVSILTIGHILKGITAPIWLLILLIYLLFSIFVHMSMSLQDTKVMLKGIWLLLITSFIFCFYNNVDIIQIFFTYVLI